MNDFGSLGWRPTPAEGLQAMNVPNADPLRLPWWFSTNWRGSSGGSVGKADRRWQQGGANLPLEKLRKRRRRRRDYGFLAALVTGLLVAGFIYALLLSSQRLTVVALVDAEYGPEFPPNAWAMEDLDKLKLLSEERTIDVVDLSVPKRTRAAAITGLRQELDRLTAEGSRRSSLVVYISMHGASDRGAACLIPNGASPLDPTTWLPVEEVFRLIGQHTPAGMKKVVVFDAARRLVSFETGTLANTFHGDVERALKSADVPNLAVLTALSPGQRSWASRELCGSAFGTAFVRALAGDADKASAGGNGDGVVSLGELRGWTAKSASAWSRHYRASRMTAELFGGDGQWKLCQELESASRRRLGERLKAVSPEAPAVTSDEVDALWGRLQAELPSGVLAYNPELVSRSLRELLWLEAAADSGRAYTKATRRVANRLTSTLAAKPAADPAEGAGPDWERFTRTSLALPKRVALHDLPLSRLFGRQPTADDRALSETRRAAIYEALASRQQETNAELYTTLSSARGALGEAWAPQDPRVFRYLEASLQAANDALLLAEDNFLVGSPAALKQSEEHLATASARLRAIEQRSRLLAEALAARDRWRVLLPGYAEWAVRPIGDSALAGVADAFINDTLLPLAGSLSELDKALLSAGAADGELSELLSGISLLGGKVEATWSDEADELLALGEDSPLAWRRLDNLLAAPVQDPATRKKLREERGRVMRRLAATQPEARSAGGSTSEKAGEPYPDRAATAWRSHPLAAMLSPILASASEDRESATEGSLATLEQSIREALVRVTTDATGEKAEGSEEQDEAAQEPAVRLVQQDAEARLAAPLAGFASQRSVAEQLLRSSLHVLLLAHAERSLDEFLGPYPGESSPFFAVACRDYLKAAGHLASGLESDAHRVKIERRLKARTAAAKDGVATVADNALLVDWAEGVQTQVTLSAGDPSGSLPSGTAAVLIQDPATRRVMQVSPEPLALPLGSGDAGPARYGFQISGSDLPKADLPLQAVAFFRGNRFADPFLVRSLSGYEVDRTIDPFVPPTVSLRAKRSSRVSVVFVLDCSHSMSEPIAVESPTGAATVERFAAARGALLAMLDEFAQTRGANAGLLLYGHRAGWNIDKPRQMLLQEAYLGEIPDELLPSEDVETVLPLGRFNEAMNAQLEALLESVKPWGETPLYLAMTRALQSFDPQDNSARAIVVITDGANYQFNAPSPTSLDDVVAAWSSNQTPIHIVGFGLDEDASGAAGDFRRIADQSGGSYARVDNAASLLETLRSRLGSGGFRVLGPSGAVLAEGDVGERLVAVGARPGDGITVAWDNLAASATVRGGEAFDLRVTGGGSAIGSATYAPGRTVFAPLERGFGGPPAAAKLGVHRTRRVGGAAEFVVSLQRDQSGISDQPAEAWVEITPQGEAGSPTAAPAYTYYDPVFEPSQPVPLLKLRADDWPEGASTAAVRAWFRWEASPVTARLSTGAAMAAGSGATVPGVEDVVCKVRVRPADDSGRLLRVAVECRHGPGAVRANGLKVDLRPEPVRIQRRIDERNRVSLHVFFVEAQLAEVREGALLFTDRTTAHRDALQVSQPVVVPVPREEEFLQLRSARGR